MTEQELKALEELLGDLAPQHDSPEAVDAMLWDLDDDDEEYLEYLAAQEAYHAAHGADASNY
jgi:hypothetical protein